MAGYFYENLKEGCAFILPKKSEEIPCDGLYNRTVIGFYSKKRRVVLLKP